MSILIKGIEMPTSCYYCPFADGTWGYSPPHKKRCLISGKDMPVDERNVQHDPLVCPLVLVPSHGRLIDADALEEILLKVIDINASIEQRNEATEQERRCLWWFEQQIGIAPTIIPAEEGE